MRQKSIGEVLRTARESRGWNFVELQRMTKIQAKYLQALEYNDFDFIPDPAYTRSFLQKYAEALDLDAAVLLDAYDNKQLVIYYEEGEEEESASELKRGYKVKKNRPKSYLPLIYLLLAATFILIFVTYIVLTRVQNQAGRQTPASSYTVVSQTSTEASSSVSSSSEASSSSSSSSQDTNLKLTVSGGGDQLAVTVKGVTGTVDVALSVKDATSWVSLTDSTIATGFTLSPESPTVSTSLAEGITSASLVLGVVEGVDVTIAGQKVDLSALTGQSATIVITIE
ncbi:cytoskeleton protein RodZ [Streptococcus oriscaviae]|uniref:Helix-turn-helix domain-containing protein n=1 Tax=Streptococcus oriscaviae TaxID=2781599 RepID=A0ABX7YJK8_9STRE|nr:cytoskeleton protein RodZ [Streptococcus oriscaviae]QUE53642.1 helix-turn-helix domain-containing protein [Streptococcus oriscaviae]